MNAPRRRRYSRPLSLSSKSTFRLLVHEQHDLALGAALHDRLERCAVARQGEGLRHVRVQTPGAVPLEQLGHVGRIALRSGLREGSPEYPHDGGHLEQYQVEWQARNIAAGESDDEIATTEAEAAQGGLGMRAAHRIVDHVHASSI